MDNQLRSSYFYGEQMRSKQGVKSLQTVDRFIDRAWRGCGLWSSSQAFDWNNLAIFLLCVKKKYKKRPAAGFGCILRTAPSTWKSLHMGLLFKIVCVLVAWTVFGSIRVVQYKRQFNHTPR